MYDSTPSKDMDQTGNNTPNAHDRFHEQCHHGGIDILLNAAQERFPHEHVLLSLLLLQVRHWSPRHHHSA